MSLSAFLTDAWVKMAKRLLPAEKELVVDGGKVDGRLTLPIKNGDCHEVPALDSDHSHSVQRIVIQSPERHSH